MHPQKIPGGIYQGCANLKGQSLSIWAASHGWEVYIACRAPLILDNSAAGEYNCFGVGTQNAPACKKGQGGVEAGVPNVCHR